MATAGAAAVLGVRVTDVVPCSTGVIGEPIHMDALIAALPTAVAALDDGGGEAFARAILTTDTVDKQATRVAGDAPAGWVRQGRRHDRAEPGHDARVHHHRCCRRRRAISSGSPTSS